MNAYASLTAPENAPPQVATQGIPQTLTTFRERIATLHQMANQMVSGKRVKIVSESFNGQLFGRSKPKLTGKQFEVLSVILSGHEVQLNISNPAIRGGEVLYCWLSDVEFLPGDQGELPL